MRIDLGVTDGTNLTESMVRIWTIQDREGLYFCDLEDVGKKAGYMFDAVKSKKVDVHNHLVEHMYKVEAKIKTLEDKTNK